MTKVFGDSLKNGPSSEVLVLASVQEIIETTDPIDYARFLNSYFTVS